MILSPLFVARTPQTCNDETGGRRNGENPLALADLRTI